MTDYLVGVSKNLLGGFFVMGIILSVIGMGLLVALPLILNLYGRISIKATVILYLPITVLFMFIIANIMYFTT